jgi:hypothetical protein
MMANASLVPNGAEISVTNITHEGLTPGIFYYYAIKSVSPDGIESPTFSQILGGEPYGALPPLKNSDIGLNDGDSQMTITWPAVPTGSRMNVYISTSLSTVSRSLCNNPVDSISCNQNVTSPFLRDGLTNGVQYFFMVEKVDRYGRISGKPITISGSPHAGATI